MAPLLIDDTGGRFIEFDANVPIGVVRTSPYLQKTFSVAPDTTLVAFTDGLVERRGEVLDVGLARLRHAAANAARGLEDLLSELAQDLISEGHHDDTAIVGIRWQS